MISISFVNGEIGDYYNEYTCNNFINEINSLCTPIIESAEYFEKKYNNFLFESELNGYIDEDEEYTLEAEGDNILAKIGNAIIGVLQKFISFLNNMIDKFKNMGFKNKSNMDKIDAYIKKRPDLKDVVIAHADDFNFNDIKSISEMDAQLNEIMKMSDPSKIKAAHEKIKKIAKGTVAVAGGVGAIAGTVLTVNNVIQLGKNNQAKAEACANDSIKNAKKDVSDIQSQINDIEKRLEKNNIDLASQNSTNRYNADNREKIKLDLRDKIKDLQSDISTLNRLKSSTPTGTKTIGKGKNAKTVDTFSYKGKNLSLEEINSKLEGLKGSLKQASRESSRHGHFSKNASQSDNSKSFSLLENRGELLNKKQVLMEKLSAAQTVLETESKKYQEINTKNENMVQKILSVFKKKTDTK